MATPQGFNKGFYGKMGSRVTYKLNGKMVSRSIGKHSKEYYEDADSFEAARINWSEFGLASGMAKSLRLALQPYKEHWCGPELSGRLSGALRKAIALGTGNKGQRNFELRQLELLHAFPLNRQKPKRCFFCTRDHLRLYPQKARAVLNKRVYELESLFGLKLREYYQISIGVILLSEIHHIKGAYQILHPEWHGRAAYKSVSGFTEPEQLVQMEVKMEGECNIPEQVGVIGVVGVWW